MVANFVKIGAVKNILRAQTKLCHCFLHFSPDLDKIRYGMSTTIYWIINVS